MTYVERGEKNVSATNLFRLAVRLGVPTRDLFDTLELDADEAIGMPAADG